MVELVSKVSLSARLRHKVTKLLLRASKYTCIGPLSHIARHVYYFHLLFYLYSLAFVYMKIQSFYVHIFNVSLVRITNIYLIIWGLLSLIHSLGPQIIVVRPWCWYTIV